VILKKGYYQLTKTESNKPSGTISKPEIKFNSATLHIMNNDSLEFIGLKNIAEVLWGHNKFKYQINGNEITLVDKDFQKKMDFLITPDSLLKLELKNDEFKSMYFEYLRLKLPGKYKVCGFQLKANTVSSEISKCMETIFTNVTFNFFKNDSVIIDPLFVQYITQDSTSFDSIFNYKILENEILFIKSGDSIKISYIYDGALRLQINDKNFERLDLGEVKK